MRYVTNSELEGMINAWSFFETIHARTYSHIVKQTVVNPNQVLRDTYNNVDIVSRSEAIVKAFDQLESLPSTASTEEKRNAIALAFTALFALEAIAFMSSFAVTFAIAETGIFQGIGSLVTLIARDEVLHTRMDYAILNITAASSLVLSSGSTLGATSGAALRVWIVGFNDGGTFRIGAVNCLSGTSIMSLMDDDIQSSTAEGGAGAADSAQVIYTGTAVTSKAMRVLGYAEWSSLTTAGTWTTPTKVQTFGPGIKLPGDVVQVQRNATGALATGTTLIPFDDTIPQNTEGDQYMSQAITPRSAANVLAVRAQGSYSNTASGTDTMIQALFQDSTAGALACTAEAKGVSSGPVLLATTYAMKAGTTSATTFKIRAGQQTAGTTNFNGYNGTRIFGGVVSSFIEVREVMA